LVLMKHLLGADQPGRRPVVAVERAAVEVLGDEHGISQDVVDRHDRPPAVEPAAHDMGDGRPWRECRLDEGAVHRLECDPLPAQIGGGPACDAMEVSGDLAPRQLLHRRAAR